MSRNTRASIVVGLVASLVSACGGGGNAGSTSATSPSPSPAPAPTPAATAEGFYNGTTSTNRTVAGFVLDDGTVWAIYTAVGQPSVAAGMIQGSIAYSNASSFSSSNVVKDFNLEGAGVLNASASGTFVPRQSLNGTVTYAIASIAATTFTATYNAAYDTTQSIPSLAGTYTGIVGESPAGRENATITITTNGAFTGRSSNGCNFSGQLTQRARGSALSFSLIFGSAPCIRSFETATGVAYNDTTSGYFYAGGMTTDRTAAAIFIGRR